MLNIYNHLLDRKVKNFKGIVLLEEQGAAYFWLYNLTGSIIGYQRYNPLGLKNPPKNTLKEDQKYWTYITDYHHQYGVKGAVWGLQHYNPNSKYLFITEGIFDAIPILNMGFNCISTLGNGETMQDLLWLFKNKHTIIVIADDDKAGRKLLKYGHHSYTCEGSKDLGDMTQYQVHEYVHRILKSI